MLEEIKLVYLKAHPLFAGICEKQVLKAASFVRIKIVPKGEILDFVEMECSKIYLLIKESIKIKNWDQNGREFIEFISAPDIFGNLSLESPIGLNQCAEVIADNTIIGFFKVSDFRILIENHSQLLLNYMQLVNAKLKRAEMRYSDLVNLDTKERLVRFIKEWAKSNGNHQGKKIILRNLFTHSDIASVISTSRQSVNILLNELRDHGLICYDRKRIEINSDFI